MNNLPAQDAMLAAILASLIQNNSLWCEFAQTIQAEDFKFPPHRAIFKCIKSRLTNGEAVTFAWLKDQFNIPSFYREKHLDQLASLASSKETAVLLRNLYLASKGSWSQILFQREPEKNDRHKTTGFINTIIQEIESAYSAIGEQFDIKTLGPLFEPGTLSILIGQNQYPLSILTNNIAYKLAHNGRSSAVFSDEPQEFILGHLCLESMIQINTLESGNLETDQDWESLCSARWRIEHQPLLISRFAESCDELCTMITDYANTRGNEYGLVLLTNHPLKKPEFHYNVLPKLKKLSQELQLPIILSCCIANPNFYITEKAFYEHANFVLSLENTKEQNESKFIHHQILSFKYPSDFSRSIALQFDLCTYNVKNIISNSVSP